MAGIELPISVTDNVAKPIDDMTTSVNRLMKSFEQLNRTASTNPFTFDKTKESVKGVGGATEQATQKQRAYNTEVSSGASRMTSLVEKAKGLALAYVSFRGISMFAKMADEVISLNTRLGMVKDNLTTVNNLNRMIFESAQATRSSYGDTAQVIAQLGMLAKDAFSSNRELVGFATIMNKSFKVSGASLQAQTAAMYQLTQAMASGKLQGDEFRSILENAPMLAQAIKKELNGIDMKKASSEGLITADVIKRAMFNAADDINKKFAQMPRTFGDVMTQIKNNAIVALAPMAAAFSKIWNNKYVTDAITGISVALVALGQVGAFVFNAINNGISFMGQYFDVIAPVIMAIVTAFLLLKGTMLAIAIVQGILSAAEAVHTAIMIAYSIACNGMTLAQWGFNSALYACPITWILVAILAVIAVLFVVVALINHIVGTHLSAIGIIVGSIYALGAIIGNILKWVANLFISVAEWIVNTWNKAVHKITSFIAKIQIVSAKVGRATVKCFDAVCNGIGNAFVAAANMAIKAINWIINALNKIPGVNIGEVGELGAVNVHHSTSNFDSAIRSLESDIAKGPETVKFNKFEYASIGDSYNKGYKVGEGFGKGMTAKLNNLKDMLNPEKAMQKNTDMLKNISKQGQPRQGGAPTGGKGGGGKGGKGMTKHLKNIDKNSKKTAENTSKQGLDVKYLREIAERRAINRFTTAEIKIENHVNNMQTQDLDGFISNINDKIQEQLNVQTEGYYSV